MSEDIERGLGRAFDEFFFKLNELFHLLSEIVPLAAVRASDLRLQEHLAEALKIDPRVRDDFVTVWREAFGDAGLEAMFIARRPAEGDDTESQDKDGVVVVGETDALGTDSAISEQQDRPVSDHSASPRPEAAAADARSAKVVEFVARHGSMHAMTEAMRVYTRLHSQLHTMANSTIVMSVGALETAIGQVERQRLREHRGAIRGNSKEFSLEELIGLGDIESVVDRAIDRRVESLCYAGPDGWKDWADGSLSIDMQEISPDWDDLLEIVQRRHIIAHNNGRVSRLYIERTGRSDVTVDQHLSSDPKYVFGAVDQIALLGLAFLVRAWCKLGDDLGHVLEHLSSRTFDALVSGHWPVAELMAMEVVERSEPASYTNLVGRVNVWLARKSGGQDISREIDDWDVSGLGVVFQLAKAALQDDVDEVVELLPAAIRANQVHRSDLLSWPLLSGVREDERFADMLALTDAVGDTGK